MPSPSHSTNPAGQSPLRIFLILIVCIGIGYLSWQWHIEKITETILEHVKYLNLEIDDIGPILNAEIDETGKVIIYDEYHEEVTSLIPTSEYGRRFTFAEMSPYQRYVLIGITSDNTAIGWIYDIEEDMAYELEHSISQTKPFGWLEDARLEYYEGCGTHTSCKHYRSISLVNPWEMELIEDRDTP